MLLSFVLEKLLFTFHDLIMAAATEGFLSDLFVNLTEQLQHEFACTICSEICREAVITNNPSVEYHSEPCAHNFCHNCIKRALENSSECVNCRRPLTLQQLLPDTKLRRQIASARVKCPNNKNKDDSTDNKACEWQGELGRGGENLDKHIKMCLYELVKCNNVGCNKVVQQRILAEHQSMECDHREYSCKYCKDIIKLLDKSNHEEKQCKLFPISCPNSCSMDSVPRADLLNHLFVCPNEKIRCKSFLNKCQHETERRNMFTHEKDCEWRDIPCKYCASAIIYNSLNVHNEICSKKPVSCTQGCGDNLIARDLLQEHIKKRCLETLIQCEFKESGCTGCFTRKNLPNHNAEHAAKHITLLAADNHSLRRDMNEMKAEISALKAAITPRQLESKYEMKAEISALTDAITAIQQESKDVASFMISSLNIEELLKQLGKSSKDSSRFLLLAMLDQFIKFEGPIIKGLNSVEPLLTVMKQHQNNAELMQKACSTLVRIAENADNLVSIARLGGIEILLSVMKQHQNNAKVIEVACSALRNIARTADNKVSIARSGGINCLLSVMKQHQNNAEVMPVACGALFNIASNADNKVDIARLSGREILLAVMEQHQDNLEVMRSASSALRNIAERG
jgi:hypothetical protein